MAPNVAGGTADDRPRLHRLQAAFLRSFFPSGINHFTPRCFSGIFKNKVALFLVHRDSSKEAWLPVGGAPLTPDLQALRTRPSAGVSSVNWIEQVEKLNS